MTTTTTTPPTTRTRQRGTCQCCGNQQVVKNGWIVKHGYKRPGRGYEIGRCLGAGERPLEVERFKLDAWTASAIRVHEDAVTAHRAAEVEHADARTACFGGAPREGAVNPYSRPNRPSDRQGPEALTAWLDAAAAWDAANPIEARYVRSKAAEQTTRTEAWQALCERGHFETLQKLAPSIHGQPLVTEVVPAR